MQRIARPRVKFFIRAKNRQTGKMMTFEELEHEINTFIHDSGNIRILIDIKPCPDLHEEFTAYVITYDGV